MSTPYGGGDPNQGTPGSGNAGFSSPPPPPPPPPPSGSTDYGQVATSPGPSYGGAPTGQLAGFWIRFGAALIDGILLNIVAFVIGLVLPGRGNSGQLIAALVGAAYFTYFHGSTGQSLGQKLVNIKVVDQESGGNIDYVRAFIRWAVSIVSGLALAIGYLWMLWDKNNQTWHDKASKALVVKT